MNEVKKAIEYLDWRYEVHGGKIGLYRDDGSTKAYELALTALREKAERDNPKPLSLDEVLKLAEKADHVNRPEWIWYKNLVNSDPYFDTTGYKIIMSPLSIEAGIRLRFCTVGVVYGGLISDYGKDFLVYRYQPQECRLNEGGFDNGK